MDQDDCVEQGTVKVTSRRAAISNELNKELREYDAKKAQQSSTTVERESYSERFKYKHPKNGPSVVATAIIKPQSGILDWLIGIKPFATLYKDTNFVLQTYRCSEEEGTKLMDNQKDGITPLQWPPMVFPVNLMTMAQRAACPSSQLGSLRITVSVEYHTANHLFPDTFIPCMFAEKHTPVVGLGPSVLVNALDLIKHLTDMIKGVIEHDSSHGFVIVDDMQLSFVFDYMRKSMTPEIDAASGKHMSISVSDRYATYLTYQNAAASNKGLVVANNTVMAVDTNDKAIGDLDEWHKSNWSRECITECLAILKRSSGARFASGEKADIEKTHCKFRVGHVFVPPAEYRGPEYGWDLEKVLPNVTSIPNWWGFLETCNLSILSSVEATTISERTITKPIGVSDAARWETLPFKAIQQFFDIIRDSTMMDPKAVFADLYDTHWPSFAKKETMPEMPASVPELIIPVAQLEAAFSCADFPNATLSTLQTREDCEETAIFFQIAYNDATPASKADGPKYSKEKVSIHASLYLTRPVTTVILMPAKRVERSTISAAAEFNATKFAPNGVEWSKLLPKISLANNCDAFEIGAGDGNDNAMPDMQDDQFFDFAQ